MKWNSFLLGLNKMLKKNQKYNKILQKNQRNLNFYMKVLRIYKSWKNMKDSQKLNLNTLNDRVKNFKKKKQKL